MRRATITISDEIEAQLAAWILRQDAAPPLTAVGKIAGRPVFVAFTIRVKDKRRFIRPVSARFMHAKEAAAYEKESAATENG